MTLCSVSCGEGIQVYRRTCTNPSPSFRGPNCEGPERKQAPCQMEPCSGLFKVDQDKWDCFYGYILSLNVWIAPFHLHISNAVNNEGMAGAQVSYQIGDTVGEVHRGITDSNGDISLSGVQLGQKIILTIVKEGFISLENTVIWANSSYTGSSHVISMSQEFKV